LGQPVHLVARSSPKLIFRSEKTRAVRPPEAVGGLVEGLGDRDVGDA